MIALLLFAAAASKIYDVSQILASDGLLSSKPLLLTVIGYEVAAGIYILVGRPFWSWRLTLATFTAFSLATIFALIRGTHCNCVSERLGPEIMLPLDLAVLALATRFRPRDTAPASPSFLKISVCILAGGMLAGVAFSRDQNTNLTNPIEFLLADELIDQTWPLGSDFHPTLKELDNGQWLVLVVRRDCEHCKTMLAQHFDAPARHRPDERTALLVAGDKRWPISLDNVSLENPSSESIEWENGEPFVASPAVFVLKNGRVVDAADGTDAESLTARLMSQATE